MKAKSLRIGELFKLYQKNKLVDGLLVEVHGWVRTNRDNGSIGFINLNDGSAFKGVQVVYSPEVTNYASICRTGTGSSIVVTGAVKLTPDAQQPFEISSTGFEITGEADDSYPMQKKRHTFEYLRDIPHLRVRSNTFVALNRVRSELAQIVHEFFHKNGFMWIHTPIITGNDGEGAGQVFDIVINGKQSDEYFGSNANLTVTGQLHVEPFALTFEKVYTFGPTFRAEESSTSRHAAEFWMIEPEMAFTDIKGNMVIIEKMLKYCFKEILSRCPEEMTFFDTMIQPGIIDRLQKVQDSKFEKMTYTKAIKLLKEAQANGHSFEESRISWGMDLQSEHERYLCEQVVNGPLFLTDYPKDIKAFYMRLNKDKKTVAAVDLLVPGVGEIVGGSEREERYDFLKKRMAELGVLDSLEWYLDLRRFGGCRHSGFGVGFDRMLMYITGLTNIRDVQPYARTYRHMKL